MACAATVPSRKRGKSKVKNFTEIQVGDMLGIKGGAKKDATLVDIVHHACRPCVAIHKKAKWLMQHAFGSAQYVLKDSQTQAVNHVLDILYEAAKCNTDECEPPARETDECEPPAAPSPPKNRRFRKLGMGLSDPDPPAPAPAPIRKSPKTPCDKKASDFVSYEHEGVRMMIKRRTNMGVLMVAEAKAVEAIVKMVRKAWEDGKDSERQNRLKRRAEREAIAGELEDLDKGRISWNFQKGSWQIHYCPSLGFPVKVSAKGLRVEENDFAGKALPSEEYQENRATFYKKAQKMWNVWDKSEKERYPV